MKWGTDPCRWHSLASRHLQRPTGWLHRSPTVLDTHLWKPPPESIDSNPVLPTHSCRHSLYCFEVSSSKRSRLYPNHVYLFVWCLPWLVNVMILNLWSWISLAGIMGNRDRMSFCGHVAVHKHLLVVHTPERVLAGLMPWAVDFSQQHKGTQMQASSHVPEENTA